MDQESRTPSDSMIGPRELLIASLVIAICLAAFRVGYWVGRDIGSALFY